MPRSELSELREAVIDMLDRALAAEAERDELRAKVAAMETGDECDDSPNWYPAGGPALYCSRRYGHRGPHRSGQTEWRSLPVGDGEDADLIVEVERRVAADDGTRVPLEDVLAGFGDGETKQ